MTTLIPNSNPATAQWWIVGQSPKEYDRPIMVENNLMFDLTDGEAVKLRSTQNVRVRGNTFTGGNGSISNDRMIGVERTERIERIYIYSNIVQNRILPRLIRITDSDEVLLFNNLLDGGIANDGSQDDIRTMNWIGDARLDGFIPRSDSPALGNAFDPGDLFSVDAFGNPRKSGQLDIGALEIQ